MPIDSPSLVELLDHRARGASNAAAAELHIAAALAAGDQRQQAIDALDRALAACDAPWVAAAAFPLLAAHGAVQRAVELARDLVARPADDLESTSRTAIALDGALLAQVALGDAPAALELLRAAGDDPTALALRAAVLRSVDRPEVEVQVLQRLADRIESAPERALVLLAVGRLRETRLQQTDEAAAAYRAAIDADGAQWPALVALCALCERAGWWEELADRLAQLAELTPKGPRRARLHYRAGLIHLDRLGQLYRATRQFAAAAEQAPSDPAPLNRLAEAHQANGLTNALITTLQQLLEQTWDRRDRATLLTQLGALYQQRRDASKAAQCCRRALEDRPAHLPALRIIGRVAQKSAAPGCEEDLLAVYQQEVESMAPVAARALRAEDLARIRLALGQIDEAVAAYCRALELDPANHRAYGRLRALLRRHQRHWDLARLIEGQLAVALEPRTRYELLRELAALQRGPLQMPDAAESSEAAATVIRQGWDDQAELLLFPEEASSPATLVSRLLQLAKQTTDPQEANWLQIQAATLLLERLERPQRALAVVEPLLDREGPGALAAVRLAARAYQKMGRWHELIALFAKELQREPDPRHGALLRCRMADIAANKLRDTERAIALYREALAEHLDCSPALDGLELLLRGEQRWRELIDLLAHRAGLRTDPLARADLLCRAAELADARADDVTRATQLYRQAVEACPDALFAIDGRRRLSLRQNEAFEVDSSEDPALALELAWFKEHRAGQAPDTALYQLAAVGDLPGDKLRTELERLLRQRGGGQLAGWLEQRATLTDEAQLAAALWLECAQRQLTAATNASLKRAGRAASRARQLCAGSPILRPVVARLLHAAGRQRKATRLHEALAADLRGPRRRLHLLHAANGRLCSNQPDRALALLHRCLVDDPAYLPALLQTLTAAEAAGRWVCVAETCSTIAELCGDRRLARTQLARAAQIWQQLGDELRELDALEGWRALGEFTAETRLTELLRRMRRFEDLLALYQEKLAVASRTAEKVELRLAAARLLRDELHDPEQAIEQFSALLRLVPFHITATVELTDLLAGQQRWSDCSVLLGLLIDEVEDADLRRSARLARARLLADELQAPKQAIELLQDALEERPGDQLALSQLVELYLRSGQTMPAYRLLREAQQCNDPRRRVWAEIELALLADNEEERYSLERDALQQAIESPELLDFFVDHYRRRQRLHRLVAIGDSITVAEPGASGRLQVALAEVLARDLNRPAAALKRLRRTLAHNPWHGEARRLCKELESGPAALPQVRPRDGATDWFAMAIAGNITPQ